MCLDEGSWNRRTICGHEPGDSSGIADRTCEGLRDERLSTQADAETIVLSSTYGRSDQTLEGNLSDDRFYSHALRRPLEPELLHDAIADVTDVAGSFDPHPATRAGAGDRRGLAQRTLDVLGRCQRVAGCPKVNPIPAGLAAQLHLLNGDAINRRLRDPNGRLQKLIAANRPVAEIIDEFYMRALGRLPSDEERSSWLAEIEHRMSSKRTDGLKILFGELLNSGAFGRITDGGAISICFLRSKFIQRVGT